MSNVIHIRLDGPPEALAAARDLLEEILGERVHLGQIVPSRRDAAGALVYGTLRLLAPVELPELEAPPA